MAVFIEQAGEVSHPRLHLMTLCLPFTLQQVQKAARKEQRVAVCIVRAADSGGGHSYLLVKRAEKGLLAGAVRL